MEFELGQITGDMSAGGCHCHKKKPLHGSEQVSIWVIDSPPLIGPTIEPLRDCFVISEYWKC